MPRNHRYVLFGPQGSGKGTQAEFLATELKVPHLATGDLLREEVARGTALGVKISETITRGALVSDEDTNSLLVNRLEELGQDTGYVLDGYPRTLNQTQFLENLFPPVQVIMLELNDEEAVTRINGRRICPNCHQVYHIKYQPPLHENKCDVCGATLEIRGDDREEAVRQRLQLYHALTEPIAEYYESLGKLSRLSAAGTIAEIRVAIREKLGLVNI
jgi:adenylate kinase